MGYQKAAIKGVTWVGLLRLFMRFLGMLRFAILARILDPSQVGIFAIASLSIALMEIITETGINVVLIQETKEDIDEFINTAWVVSILRGFIIGLPIFIFSHTIAQFFHIEQSQLLIQISALVPIIKGFINPSVAKFQKNLQFSKEFLIRITQTLIDTCVSIFVALLIHSEYSLVWGMLAGAIAELVLSHLFAKPRPSLHFTKPIFKRIIHRGKWITLTGIFIYLYNQGPDIIIGKLLSSYNLGIWQAAYKLAFVPINELLDIFNRVAFPVYVKIKDDQIRTRKAFAKNLLIVNCITLPLAGAIYFYALPITQLVLGVKWLEAAQIMPILALYIAISGISGPASPLILAFQKQKQLSMIHISTAFLFIISAVYLTPIMGLMGIATSLMIVGILFMPVYLFLGLRQLL